MDGEQNDFVVETKGHCFLCFKQKPTSFNWAESVIDPSSLNSLQCLSRYIRMDMGKVFCSDDLESIPPHLLVKVQKSILKVELCERCVPINDRFSRLYRQLEKIEMEMTSCLKVILAQLEEDTTKIEMTPQTSSLDKGKLEVVEALSSVKICGSRPRVKIKGLTRKEIHSTITRKPSLFKSSRSLGIQSMEEEYQPSNVKLEEATDDFFMDDANIDNGYLDQHEDCNENVDEEYATPAEGVKSSESFSNDPSREKKLDSDDVTPTANTHSISVTLPSSSSHRTVTSELAWTINPKTGKRKCKTCSKEFSGSSGFIAHYRRVHLQAKYKCNLCGKEFTSQSGYKSHHQAVHIGVRFKCLVCTKCFSDSSNLRRHQRTCGGGNLQV